MGKFQFQSNSIHLDIAGHIFDIPGTVEYAEKIKEFSVQAQERARKLQEIEDSADAIQEASEFLTDTINGLLGDGASEKIFAGRAISLYDCIDVMQYICGEFNQFQKSKLAQYSPVRIQRRAK